MHFVRFTGKSHDARGDFEMFTPRVGVSGAVGVVTEMRDDLTEIDEATYIAELAAIRQYNAAIPVAPVASSKLTLEQRVAALEAKVK
jgi:hypothetical protein